MLVQHRVLTHTAKQPLTLCPHTNGGSQIRCRQSFRASSPQNLSVVKQPLASSSVQKLTSRLPTEPRKHYWNSSEVNRCATVRYSCGSNGDSLCGFRSYFAPVHSTGLPQYRSFLLCESFRWKTVNQKAPSRFSQYRAVLNGKGAVWQTLEGFVQHQKHRGVIVLLAGSHRSLRPGMETARLNGSARLATSLPSLAGTK